MKKEEEYLSNPPPFTFKRAGVRHRTAESHLSEDEQKLTLPPPPFPVQVNISQSMICIIPNNPCTSLHPVQKG